MKTKPFDLAAAKAGAKVVTYNGAEVTSFIAFDRQGDYPVMAYTRKAGTRKEYWASYTSDGREWMEQAGPDDLAMLTDEQGNYIYTKDR